MNLGQLVMTKGVSEKIWADWKFGALVSKSIKRYVHKDWGDVSEEDAKMNDLAVKHGDDRILARYNVPDSDDPLWIITEWDHSVTTLLFASEY